MHVVLPLGFGLSCCSSEDLMLAVYVHSIPFGCACLVCIPRFDILGDRLALFLAGLGVGDEALRIFHCFCDASLVKPQGASLSIYLPNFPLFLSR
jgi:hypothetical protein